MVSFLGDGEKMSQVSQIILSLFILAGFYFLSKKVYAYRINRAYVFVIEDLKKQEAFDPITAVELPYANTNMVKNILQFKMKDFRPKAIERLIIRNFVGMTEMGRYYLKKGRNFKWTPELNI